MRVRWDGASVVRIYRNGVLFASVLPSCAGAAGGTAELGPDPTMPPPMIAAPAPAPTAESLALEENALRAEKDAIDRKWKTCIALRAAMVGKRPAAEVERRLAEYRAAR